METITTLTPPPEKLSPYFDKRTTDCLKGIALIFMFVHHLLTLPKRYIEGISYPELSNFARIFCSPFRSCVCIFAFLTGYAYVLQKSKTMKRSVQKTILFLSSYWFVFTFLIIVQMLLGIDLPSAKNLLLEFLTLKRSVMFHCWYVIFYCMAILALPILAKFMDDGPFKAFLFGILAPVIAGGGILPFVRAKSNLLWSNLKYFPAWFPCVAAGYIACRYDLFGSYFDRKFKNNIKSRFMQAVIWCGMAAAAFLGRYCMPSITFATISSPKGAQNLTLSFDFIYAPVLIYALVNLLRLLPEKNILLSILEEIGKKSMLMWFLHGVVNNACKDIFQPIIYFPKNPVLVILWALAFFYAAACIVDFPVKKLQAAETKLFAHFLT